MLFDNPIDEAKFMRTRIIDATGRCFIVVPSYKAINGDRLSALIQYQNSEYWAKYLLRSHCDMWGYNFDFLTLYHQLCPSPLMRHKSLNEMIDEIGKKISCGEFLVYQVDCFIPPAPVENAN
ncbi:hypothetical protein [Photobacterium sp. J15]|uniref:hypothetical protein n=1 Tax=Photobacterium sp. J15 TaxID=265901 RepID=UPI0007E2DF30|nr:hypothetical protein [Photobacterium sp. J15]